MEQVWEEAAKVDANMTREFHIVGGLDMQTGIDYYEEMFRGLKQRHPQVHIKALTAVEIAHIAAHRQDVGEGRADSACARRDSTRCPVAAPKCSAPVCVRPSLIASCLVRNTSTSTASRTSWASARIARCSMATSRRTRIASTTSVCCAIFKDETGGFLAYIPLAYHPDNNELGVELGRTGTATTGFDDLKNLAVGRLFLDNFTHVKSHWIMVTPAMSQMSLHFGVNDLEGTVVREKIYHEAGAHTAQAMSLDEILRIIRGAGKTPAERDSFYNVLRVFDEPTPPRAEAA
jgi:aminodeoxyfutalosine synthase